MSSSDSVQEKCLQTYNYLFRPDLLRGKVAFITGGGTGIGFTIAEILMRHQCDTVILSRRLEKLTESAKTLKKNTGRECIPIKMDVRKPQEILAAVDEALATFGKIDFVINNAAGNFLCPASALSFNAFRTVMEIDAQGTFNISKAVYDKCLKKHGGVIVNISATLHYRGSPLQVHAGSAKAAVDAMTKHLAVEWGEDGVRVISVSPGPIADTEGMKRLGGKRAEATGYQRNIPLQRMGRREEIGNTVLFAVSDAASLLTGTVIVADGGAWLSTGGSYASYKQMMGSKL
ncbi:peroxisomal 2,4-dienoyl-CoA reductase [(3E)-enoyl-CoA-producing]-like [Liolophura sinensis]|uniref:peroxisomal 2,4-dienoyl-CoA reductase [(3E)-enoyl-CoA-producing]-like n=1 Tax=Liolophura sinensis TaxID=3198878 RepID=UPI003159634B